MSADYSSRSSNDKQHVLEDWSAAQETPRGPGQPYLHGYNAKELKAWSPDTDPYARFFRSRVPLVKRIAPFAPTQAHPALTYQAKVMNLSADYDKEEWFGAYRYNDSFSRNVLKFWQYQDIYAAWHGLPVYGSPEEERQYGVVNLPNPAYTDAAHRNGVISLGGWFWPRDTDFGELVEETEDGRFPVADKMIEMAEYFGFDGYFVNQEASISEEHAAQLMKMLKYMRESGLYFSWYDSLAPNGELQYINFFNEMNAPWVLDQRDGRQPNDSIFINYAYTPERLEKSNAYAKEIGLDPYEALYAGVENDKFRFERGNELKSIFRDDEARTPRMSVALFGTDMVWHRGPNPSDPKMQQYIEHRERIYWSGAKGNPAQSGRGVGSEGESWDGLAHFIPERSVIGSYPFVTRFNNGHGLAFFLNGEVASRKGWNNVSAQELLPTWQWWVASEGNPLAVDYDYSTAWNGGSSIKAEGLLDPGSSTDIRLFKTDLPTDTDVLLSLTCKLDWSYAGNQSQDNEPDSALVQLQMLLYYQDQPETPEVLSFDAVPGTDWTTLAKRLAGGTKRRIAAIGVRIISQAEKSIAVKVNLGELKLIEEAARMPVLAAPTGFQVEHAYFREEQASLILSWKFADDSVIDNLWYYDLYRVKDGKREAIGRIFDDVFYVKSVERLGEHEITLEAMAVNKEGVAGLPAVAVWSWGDGEAVDGPAGPYPAESLQPQFNTEEDIVLEPGWSRYLNIRVEPAWADNLSLTWTSSNAGAVTVNERGQITAVVPGEAVITAATGNLGDQEGPSLQMKVSVVAPEAAPEGGITLEAEQYNRSNGLFVPGTYVHVRDLHFANWMAFDNVDFGADGVSRITVRAAVLTEETRMLIHIGDAEGPLVADMELPLKDGKLAPFYHNYSMELAQPLIGRQTLYVTFQNPNIRRWQVRDTGIADIDWIHFS